MKLWLEGSIQTDVCSLLFSKLPVQYCAAGMVNTLKVAACVTAAGRAQSVTFPPTSALTSHAVATGPALWELVSATQATKAKTVKKVIFFNESLYCLVNVKKCVCSNCCVICLLPEILEEY